MNTRVRPSSLRRLFALDVAAAELEGAGDAADLFADEGVGRERWSPKRLAEFAAGRACARHALAACGLPVASIPVLPDRRPAWPEGVVGSITHCAGFAAAVVAPAMSVASLGIDAEPADAVEPALWPRVLGTAERDWLQSLPTGLQRTWATVLFSAKEAFYKCQFPVTGRWLEFHDVQVTVEDFRADGEAFTLRASDARGGGLHGRALLRAPYVFTGFAWPR